MFGRIFGRDKDDQDQAVCAECGRTLLAGEWTQTIVGPDGEEQALTDPHAQPVEMGKRRMRGWVRVAEEGLRTRRQLSPWVRRGAQFARSLPPRG